MTARHASSLHNPAYKYLYQYLELIALLTPMYLNRFRFEFNKSRMTFHDMDS